MKLYVNFKPPKTLKKFLEAFFTYKYTNGWDHYYPVGHAVAVPTFRDKACKRLQCPAGRNRSVQDLYSCVTTYFPNVTLEKLIQTLVKLRPNNRYFYGFRCSEIRRPVIGFAGHKIGIPPIQSRSEYDWNKLLKRVGINTMYDMYGE